MHLKQQHFIEAVNKLIKKSSSHFNLKSICSLAAESPAPQFYINPHSALNKYFRYKKTGEIDVDRDFLKPMYLCIFERYEAAVKEKRNVEFKYAIMQDVLESPAPSFYIPESAAAAYYYRAMKYKRKLNKK